jgi:hypothetical protein
MTKKFPNGKSVKTHSVFEKNHLIKNMFPVWSDGYCLQVDQPNYNLFEDLP